MNALPFHFLAHYCEWICPTCGPRPVRIIEKPATITLLMRCDKCDGPLTEVRHKPEGEPPPAIWKGYETKD